MSCLTKPSDLSTPRKEKNLNCEMQPMPQSTSYTGVQKLQRSDVAIDMIAYLEWLVSYETKRSDKVISHPCSGDKQVGFMKHSNRRAGGVNPAGAICVQHLRSHCICNSNYLSQLAAVFIDPRTKWSITESCKVQRYKRLINIIYIVCGNCLLATSWNADAL